jgi:Tat protein secretion system quality control protein TatD with DNase activity
MLPLTQLNIIQFIISQSLSNLREVVKYTPLNLLCIESEGPILSLYVLVPQLAYPGKDIVQRKEIHNSRHSYCNKK